MHNAKKLKALTEIRKQHLLLFYFSLVKIYITYITCTEESHSLSQKKLSKKHIQGADLFIQLSVKPTFRARQVTIKTTKAQEACANASEELNWR